VKRRDDADVRWKMGDVLIMIAVAMRVLLPYLAVIVAAVVVAWGLLALVFG